MQADVWSSFWAPKSASWILTLFAVRMAAMLCWDIRLKSNVHHQNLCHGVNYFCMSLTVKFNCSLLCAFYQCIILTCILILMIHIYHLIPPNTWYLNSFFFRYLIGYSGTNLVRCLVLGLFMEGSLIDDINMSQHVKLVI